MRNLTLRLLLSARGSREAHQASLGGLRLPGGAESRASARGVEQAMPPGLTLDRRGETQRAKATGAEARINVEPWSLSAQRAVPSGQGRHRPRLLASRSPDLVSS